MELELDVNKRNDVRSSVSHRNAEKEKYRPPCLVAKLLFFIAPMQLLYVRLPHLCGIARDIVVPDPDCPRF
jgi:hypothetical protein